MSSALPAVPTSARSMLEEMLVSLKLSDEKPKDEPPALPARPTLKRRPPSSKNNLKFKIESEVSSKDSHFTEKACPESTGLSNGVIEQGRAEKVVHSGEEDLGSFEKSHTSQKLDCVEEQDMVLTLRLEALEKVVDEVKEELRRKEGENIALLQKVQEYETRCSVCEEKMHSMEDMYQKQIQTLKLALDVAQENRSVDDETKRRTSDETPTTYQPVNDAGGKSNNAVFQLAKEFEKQKQVFEDDAKGLCKVKSSGQTEFARKSFEELRKLKAQYASWKKEYKARLHDAKKALRELAKPEGEKHSSRRWWCKRRIIRNRISLCSSA